MKSSGSAVKYLANVDFILTRHLCVKDATHGCLPRRCVVGADSSRRRRFEATPIFKFQSSH
jgi:hypothetical protein